jgi:FkbM family methyltransferase
VRRELLKVADSLGIRQHLGQGRDQLVEILTGQGTNTVHRRNHTDDRNVKLLLSFLLRPGSNCLDVGANNGTFLTVIRRVAPGGHHIAYEPLPELCAQLRERFPEMEVRQRALADQEGESTFVHVLEEPAYSGLKAGLHPPGMHTERITVLTERLDDHLPSGWLPDFVKIDVEGAEALVLTGAMDTLRRAKPVLAFEHGGGCGEAFGATDADIFALVCQGAGLRLFDMDGNGPLSLPQFEEELATGLRWNWIAHE